MRLVGTFLSACVILAAVKAAIIALALLFLIALLWGMFLHPKEVLSFLTFCAMLTVFTAHPFACLLIIGAAVIFVQLVKKTG